MNPALVERTVSFLKIRGWFQTENGQWMKTDLIGDPSLPDSGLNIDDAFDTECREMGNEFLRPQLTEERVARLVEMIRRA